MFRKKKLGEGMIHGNTKEMEITVGKIKSTDRIWRWKKADAAGNVRFGYNSSENAFWIQIFHKKSEIAYRLFMTPDEYKSLIISLTKTYKKTDETTKESDQGQQ